MIFPAHDEASVVVQPSKEAFDSPAFAGAAQAPAVLSAGVLPSTFPMRSDHLGAIFGEHLFIQPIAVVSFIADQDLGRISDKAVVHRLGHQFYFSRGSTRCANGDRKTMA